jgi:hypothetical protein
VRLALYIEPGSPWENGYCKSFNSKLRDELLAGEQFSTLYEAQVLIEQWRRHYNGIRPHSSLGYRPPAPETILPPASALPYAAPRPDQTLASSGRTLIMPGTANVGQANARDLPLARVGRLAACARLQQLRNCKIIRSNDVLGSTWHCISLCTHRIPKHLFQRLTQSSRLVTYW